MAKVESVGEKTSEHEKSPPKQETDSHAGSPGQEQVLWAGLG